MSEQFHDQSNDGADAFKPAAFSSHDWAVETAEALAGDQQGEAIIAPDPDPSYITPGEPETTVARRRSNATAANRSLIRRSIAKFEELYETHDLGLLPVVFGIPVTDVTELTVAVLTATPKDLLVLTDAASVANADPVEAGIVAAALGRGRLRHVWKLFASIGTVSGDLPASDAKAAIALVHALVDGGVGDLIRSRFNRTAELLRKN